MYHRSLKAKPDIIVVDNGRGETVGETTITYTKEERDELWECYTVGGVRGSWSLVKILVPAGSGDNAGSSMELPDQPA